MDTKFPIYSAHLDGSAIYFICSSEQFEEYKRIGAEGSPYIHTLVVAKDYFERLYIQDLIEKVKAGELRGITEEAFKEIASKAVWLLNFLPPRALDYMVVDHTDCLHESVAYSGAYELEALLF